MCGPCRVTGPSERRGDRTEIFHRAQVDRETAAHAERSIALERRVVEGAACGEFRVRVECGVDRGAPCHLIAQL